VKPDPKHPPRARHPADPEAQGPPLAADMAATDGDAPAPADVEVPEGVARAPELSEEGLPAAQEEAALYRDRWLRAAAELENFKRRTQREREEWTDRRTAEIFEGLLRVRDDFERALGHAADTNDDPVLAGVRLVYRRLVEFCERHGVTPIVALGQPFDPALHDALLQVRRADVPPDTVVEVALPGYRLGERVLRHAQVVVSAAPGEGA